MASLKTLLFLLTLWQGVLTYNPLKYEGYELLSITPKTNSHVEYLKHLQNTEDIDFWDEPKAINKECTIFASPDQLHQVKPNLKYQRIPFTVKETGLTEKLQEEWSRLSEQSNMNYNYTDFNNFTKILTELDHLATQCHPDLTCTITTIGYSYEGRPINMLAMTKAGENRRAVWIDSEIHAREWLAAATTMNIFNKLITEYGTGTDPRVDSLINLWDWYYVPVMNPDGYVYTWDDTRLWRKNRRPNEGSSCIGTDLNRNYDVNWGEPGAGITPCSDTYRGISAASESETEAVQNQVLSISSNIEAFWSVHTHGEYLLAPYGNCTTPPAEIWERISKVTNATCDTIQGTFNDLTWQCGNSCEVLYETSGTTSDWAHVKGGITYSWTPELRGPGFIVPPSAIPLSFEEIFNGVDKMMKTIMEKRV